MSLATLGYIVLFGLAQSTDPAIEGTRTGSRVDPALRSQANTDLRARDAATYRFIECAVARRTSQMRDLLDARTEEGYGRAQDALADIQRCNIDAYVAATSSVVSFATERPTLRGLVAEALVKQDRDAVQALQPMPLQRVYERGWFAMTGRARPIDEMATCVADTNPQAIYGLLQTDVSSDAQRAAIGALAPALGPCLATGFRLNSNALGLRTALAEALYHRMSDAPSAAEGAQR